MHLQRTGDRSRHATFTFRYLIAKTLGPQVSALDGNQDAGVWFPEADSAFVSTNYFLSPKWNYTTPNDTACWKGITRRKNMLKFGGLLLTDL